ncbi:MAG TPA: glycosyltransferase family 4 protein [Roseiflexaceae bacterium]|jgi:glycosyltransferase involved in cell wall biosynthesis|nr:glycosyltransferase family 4 protein [Roseiflexaceae bacterium]
MTFGVAMISSVFFPSIGGAQTVILDVGRKLQERGVPVLVVTRHYQGLARYEEVGGLPTYRVGRGDSNKAVAALSFIQGAVQVLAQQQHRYNVLHCHQMISPMTIGLMAKALVRKPLVVMPHRSGDIGDIGILTQRRPVTGRVRLAAARQQTDAFVCISKAIHDELRGIGVPESKLWDIVNGVDMQRFQPGTAEQRATLRQQLGLPGGPLAIFTGRLVPEKGIDVLLRAWPAVLQHVPDASVVLVGAGEQRAQLEALARQQGIESQVVFAGGSDDVAPFLRAADAFVLPSYAEGLPVALLEAMACGLPCVGTAIDGTRNVIEDGVSGRLVPAGDAAALGRGLVEALASSAAQEWGLHARQKVSRDYSLDAVADAYIAMYTTLLQPQARQPVSNQA